MNKTNKILRHYKIRIESVYERKKSKYCERLVILIDKMNNNTYENFAIWSILCIFVPSLNFNIKTFMKKTNF